MAERKLFFIKRKFKSKMFSFPTHLGFSQFSCLLAAKQSIITIIVFESSRPCDELLEEDGLNKIHTYTLASFFSPFFFF